MKLKTQTFGTFKFPNDYDIVKQTMLNKSDLREGNNKFYSIEAHVSKDGTKFRLFSVYGRVGAPNPRKEERIPPQDRSSLDRAFDQLLKEKTSAKKGYKEIAVATTKVGSEKAKSLILSDDIKKDKIQVDNKPTTNVKLDPLVSTLVNRLYNEANQAIQNTLNTGQLKSAVDNPLGTLTLTQIKEGRDILQTIQKKLKQDASLIDKADASILQLTNEFNTVIPQIIPVRPNQQQIKNNSKALEQYFEKLALNNSSKLDEKEDLLELLEDVEGMSQGFASNSLIDKYKEIGAEFTPLTKSSDEYKFIVQHMKESKSRHHSWSAKVLNIWTIDIPGQKKHVTRMDKVGNIEPLYHGSRLGNILGICKHGLLMRPPGVYITGSMFGNGLYFANQSSKSEQYSTARFGGGGRGADSYFMFIADVALGKIKSYTQSNSSLTKPPAGYHSVKGAKGNYLLHDEFIIYDVNQHKLQYLIEFKI